MVVLGCVSPLLVVLSLRGEGWKEWEGGRYYIGSLLILIPYGTLLVRAAWKGRDPTAL